MKFLISFVFFLLVPSLLLAQMPTITIDIGSDTDVGYAGDVILSGQGVNDPHIHIFDGKAYLFSSHDKGVGYSDYTMPDWQIYSSPDLVHWTKEFVLKPEDTYIGTTSDKCFATDGAERNGKHYFYFSHYNKSTGVAVSTSGPGGPYVPQTNPILPENLTWNNEYDPTIFIDDDNTPYIIWGYTGWGAYYQIAELNEDMVSLKTSPSNLTVTDDVLENDGGYLHKHNGIYYLNTHHGKYATSTNLKGPYTYRGEVEASGDHGTFFTWHNQTYYTWGVWESAYFRATKVAYCHYKDNGDIVCKGEIGAPALGVGRYDANWDKVEAEWYFACSDEMSKKEGASAFELTDISNYTYLFYPRVHNLEGMQSVTFRVASGAVSNATIEIREGSTTGALLGTCTVENTGGWEQYQEVSCNISAQSGAKNLYLVFKGGEGELMRLDWFKFSDTLTTNTEVEATSLSHTFDTLSHQLSFNYRVETVALMNIDGTILLQAYDKQELDIAHLPMGVYVARVSFGGEISSFKFVKSS